MHYLNREIGQTEGDHRSSTEAGDLNLDGVLSWLLPEVTFLRDSFDELFSFQDPAPMLRLIGEVITNPTAVKSKRLEGTGNKKWREIDKHISTGVDNTGRLYYLREGDQLQLLISRKKRQKLDVVYREDF